jgi:hypothetical protein
LVECLTNLLLRFGINLGVEDAATGIVPFRAGADIVLIELEQVARKHLVQQITHAVVRLVATGPSLKSHGT